MRIILKKIDILLIAWHSLEQLTDYQVTDFYSILCIETDTSQYEATFGSILCVKKIDSSFVPIRLLTKIKIFQSDRIIS